MQDVNLGATDFAPLDPRPLCSAERTAGGAACYHVRAREVRSEGEYTGLVRSRERVERLGLGRGWSREASSWERR